MVMKTTLLGLSMGFCLTLNAQAQLAKTDFIASNKDQVAINSTSDGITTPDVSRVNVFPSASWLQSFSSSLMEHISYPARGKAYQITGTMYAKISLNTNGKLQVVGFQKSLGSDFEKAIIDGLNQLPDYKIKSLDLSSEGTLILLPIKFKE